MGTPAFAVASLSALLAAKMNVVAVVTAPDKPGGRGMQLQQSAVKQFAIENNITLLFNAPYSPIFNPIELIFNTIKKNFKELNHDNIEDDINNAIKEAYNIKIQKLYDHCWEHIIKYKNTIMI